MLQIKQRTFTPLLGQILQKIAPRIGAKVIMEPQWNIVGQIVFKSGRKRYFRYSSLDLNPLGASEIARDKDYANFFMKKMNYPTVPQSRVFYRQDWAEAIGQAQNNIDAAYLYAKKIGLPVFVKPNSGTQGIGVALVYNKNDFYRAVRTIFKNDRLALVQPRLEGRDYRLVVLDNKLISAYERLPLSIVGNGVSNIAELLAAKQADFVNTGRDTKIKFDDYRIKAKLRRLKLDFKDVLPLGRRCYLLDNANLSTGGESVDVTAKVHSDFKKLALSLVKDMGLRFCGVDLMVQGDIGAKPQKFWILEINAAPGLDHYVKTGKAQEKIVEDMYLEVLKSLDKK
ncbi:MAG: cyanophycin synthetase [Patescibacteria group bacterium]|nr:cyanophycin synthetase [Patescibacteria group bacterium]